MKIRQQPALTLACAWALGATLAAQRGVQPPSTDQSEQPRAPSAQAASTITMTGCLVRDTATNAAQSQGPGPAQSLFKLTNVQMMDASGAGRPTAPSAGNPPPATNPGASTSTSTSSATSSASARGSAMSQPTEYQLRAGAGVDLAPHENHRVQVTGTSDGRGGRSGPGMDNSTGAATAPGAGSPNNTASGESRGGNAQDAGSGRRGQAGSARTLTLTVTSVTMISSTCP